MYGLHHHRHRKPDFLATIVLVVVFSLLATLVLHMRALDAPAVSQTSLFNLK